jgi:hypothetical protein
MGLASDPPWWPAEARTTSHLPDPLEMPSKESFQKRGLKSESSCQRQNHVVPVSYALSGQDPDDRRLEETSISFGGALCEYLQEEHSDQNSEDVDTIF